MAWVVERISSFGTKPVQFVGVTRKAAEDRLIKMGAHRAGSLPEGDLWSDPAYTEYLVYQTELIVEEYQVENAEN